MTVFCAMDVDCRDKALALVKKLSPLPVGFKLGLEFFNAEGLSGVKAVRDAVPDHPLFLDLKLHDIPNTVDHALRAVLRAHPDYITVHASGGTAMMRAAAEAARQAGEHRPKILGVTVLTHLDDQDLAATGQGNSTRAQVARLAKLAASSGLDGVICSPHEIADLRALLPADFLLVVPGIRPADTAQDDQKRTMTPKEASSLGANHLVIGRPITRAPDPAVAAAHILEALAA